MSLNNVTGAFRSVDAANLKSLVNTVGRDFTCLCSTTFFTLERNRNEFMTAGSNAITPIISELPAMAIAPYNAPSNNVPESPGNILLGYL
jgi:enamine deaminase RidA (YjgF/YER057c/UK114 family)